MSNAEQASQSSGKSRRRRSRGGRNRDNQSSQRGSRGSRSSKSGRSEEFRLPSSRQSRGKKPLSWWQKLLKLVGLYKEPVRSQRKTETSKSRTEPKAAKSNTRNARTTDGSAKSGEGQGRRGSDRSRGGDPSTVESTRVYVGNLSYDVTEQDLQELFKGVGPVRSVEIVYNRTTHRSKGYGFVQMLNMDDAIRCVEVLHDQPFMGRKLTVSGAKAREMEERNEAADHPERSSRPIVLAPIPPSAEASAPSVAEVADEPVIQTIVESVPAETEKSGIA
ncbi:MAG: RNA recognition motif domain-containing protein [Luteolibacter sp.]